MNLTLARPSVLRSLKCGVSMTSHFLLRRHEAVEGRLLPAVVLDPRHPHPLAEELVRQRAVLG
ncbi:MAG: hypothetical protein ACYTGK_02480, partial [Planctomycetota bacterium]